MNHRWTIILGALLLAAVVGGIAYNAGIAQGMAQSGKIVTMAPPPGGAYPSPYPYYGWYRPWGFVSPFFVVFLGFLVLRGLFWRRGCYGYGCGGSRFEEWHRRMHERMETPQP